MRGAIFAIALFLLAGTALLTLWPFGHGGFAAGGSPAPPGQYPIGLDRPEWSVTEQTKSFGPSPGMGSNTVRSNGERLLAQPDSWPAAPKVLCAMGKTCPVSLLNNRTTWL
jgi:hypothetical protein